MLNAFRLNISNSFSSIVNIIFIFSLTFVSCFTSNNIVYNDSPEPWAIGFQDGVSPGYTGIIELHDNIFFYLVVIAILVFWMLGSTIYYFNYDKTKITHKYLVHGTLIEILWTIFPAIVLLAIAIPSFRLLYILDEVTLPTITVKVTGHQWYWSYEYSDYETESGDPIEFDSYMVPDSDLEIGQTRLLEVDNPIVLPENTHVRFIVTSTDVLHDFAIPAAGIKIDATPGRLNQSSFYSERIGELFGQCSELCGTYHGFMPIQVEVGSIEEYLSWISSLTTLMVFTKNKNNSPLTSRLPKDAAQQKSLSTSIGKKSNFNSIILGLKKGYYIDTLPPKVRLFLEKPVIIILRAIGGLCVILYLLNKNGNISYDLPYILNLIIQILAFIQLIQIVLISIIKLVYGIKILIRHREEFEIRNSPLNKLASVTAKLVFCWKMGCNLGSAGVGLLGISVLIFGVLYSSGPEPIYHVLLRIIFNLTIYDLAKIWLVGNIGALLYFVFSFIAYIHYCKLLDKGERADNINISIYWPTLIFNRLKGLIILSNLPEDLKKKYIKTYWLNILLYSSSVSFLSYYLLA